MNLTAYWTMQTLEAWNSFQKKGYLEGDMRFASYKEEYLWMMDQMKHRLPSYDNEVPIWLWLSKPDMRSTGHFSGGTHCVRIQLELDPDSVLLSDFDAWHSVLNDAFCSFSENEYNLFYDGKLTLTKEESWERIFDLTSYRDSEWNGSGPLRLQGVTGRINLDSIKKVEHFITRKTGAL